MKKAFRLSFLKKIICISMVFIFVVSVTTMLLSGCVESEKARKENFIKEEECYRITFKKAIEEPLNDYAASCVFIAIYGFKLLPLFKDNFDWFDYDKKTQKYSLKSGHSKEIYPLLNYGEEVESGKSNLEYGFTFKFENGRIREWISFNPFSSVQNNQKYIIKYNKTIEVTIPEHQYEEIW